MIKFQIGDRVKHDFSNERGVITGYRTKSEYNYFVEWDYRERQNDWYKADVLELIS